MSIENEILGNEEVKMESEVMDHVEEIPKSSFNLDILKAKTGDGEIENYINHPLNFNESRGIAQSLRGFTGLFGALDYALIDILVGFMQFTKERKNVSQN